MSAITAKHLREAIQWALSRPSDYDQGAWGDWGDCSSARCVWGEACRLAGIRPAPPHRTGHAAGAFGDAIADLDRCTKPGILQLMKAVREDGSIPQSILSRIARKKDVDWEVRYYAVKRLNDQAVLAEIAATAADWCIRRIAEERLAAIRRSFTIEFQRQQD